MGMAEQTPVAEDWYRRGVMDAVSREQEAVAASFRLPFLRVNVERPRRRRAPVIEPAAMREEADRAGAEGWRIGRFELPSPRKTAYYLGLGALAAFEVVEWPVAAAVAAGTWVAQHTRPEAPAAGTAPWELLHRGGGHGHDEHSENGHAGPAAMAGAHTHNGHSRRRTSAGS
ncbi:MULTISPECIES: hypothetical protein [unclassified Pseudofrankia]|uniref:hypothetical protein n=1 Tax=unclassified Pseudofrankia TaxID=2994372 RepID=UPI0008DA7FCF|nr:MULTISPECIES: hypothetical protein [unclassified Pseudofrankia]MDT3442357.1 hypothetical protein [Pseudofrankia sp. BMG5.37]